MATRRQAAIARMGVAGVVLLPLAGCTGQSPVAPDETRTVTDGRSSGGNWELTRTITEISDPASCYAWPPRVGIPIVSGLEIERSEELLRLVLHNTDEPQNRTEYTGTLKGDEFTARTQSLRIGYSICRDGAFQATVTGRFSPDRRSLVAEELWVFELDGGGNINVFFTWAGRSQSSRAERGGCCGDNGLVRTRRAGMTAAYIPDVRRVIIPPSRGSRALDEKRARDDQP